MFKNNTGSNIDLEEICNAVRVDLNKMLRNAVVNKELAAPMNLMTVKNWEDAKQEYIKRYITWNEKTSGTKVWLAKSWLLIAVFFFALLKEFLKQNPKHVQNFMLTAIVLVSLTRLYYVIFGSFPLQSIGMFFLNTEQRQVCHLHYRACIALKQAEHVGPHSPWRLFIGDSKLEEAMQNGNMNYFEHDAMLRGLFSAKNKAFDCIAISAIVILKLIEKNLPVSIERFRKAGNFIDAHSFVVVNRTEKSNAKNIYDWNDDCIIICLWYGICISVKKIKECPSFFLQYPLLDPSDKIIERRIIGDQPPHGYKIYLEKLQAIIDKEEATIDTSYTNC